MSQSHMPSPSTLDGSHPAIDRTLHCRLVAEGSGHPQVHLGDLAPINMHVALGLAEPSTGKSHATVLLATLGACLVDRIRANASIGNIALTNLEIEIEADPGDSPLWGGVGHQPGPVGLETIRVRVRAESDASEDALRALVDHAALWSPLANTLHAPVHLDVALATRASAPVASAAGGSA